MLDFGDKYSNFLLKTNYSQVLTRRRTQSNDDVRPNIQTVFLGKICLPPGGPNLTFISGSTAKIKWSFDVNISHVNGRIWYFEGSGRKMEIATIIKDQDSIIRPSPLFWVSIEKPATLVLKNVNQSFTGTYTFGIYTTDWEPLSLVFVSIKGIAKNEVEIRYN